MARRSEADSEGSFEPRYYHPAERSAWIACSVPRVRKEVYEIKEFDGKVCLQSTDPLSCLASPTGGFRMNSGQRRVGGSSILRCGDHVFALIAEDLEDFVEDRSKLGEDRAATNATAFVMLHLRLWNAHPIHFPIDVLPT